MTDDEILYPALAFLAFVLGLVLMLWTLIEARDPMSEIAGGEDETGHDIRPGRESGRDDSSETGLP